MYPHLDILIAQDRIIHMQPAKAVGGPQSLEKARPQDCHAYLFEPL
jgi:hypothetical protein